MVQASSLCLILLREHGLPCVFYGDYYGISGQYAQQDFREGLDRLLAIRKDLAYGEQTDYFDDPNCIGWVRAGAEHQSPQSQSLSQTTKKTASLCLSAKNGLAKPLLISLKTISSSYDRCDGYGQFQSQRRAVSVWAANTI